VKWVLGLNRRKLAKLLSIIFILQLLLNVTVYYGIWYLQENKNLRFGYRLESTSYHEAIQFELLSYDREGFTIITRNIANIDHPVRIERYDTHQNLLWVVTRSQFSIDEYLASSSQYLVLCDQSYLPIRSNYKNSTTRTFFVYRNGNLVLEDLQDISIDIASQYNFELNIQLRYREGKIINDFMIIPEFRDLNFFNDFIEYIPDIGLENLSLIYYNLKSFEESSVLLNSSENISMNYRILRESATTFNFVTHAHENPYLIEIYQVDLSLANIVMNKLGEIDLSTQVCIISQTCDFELNGRDSGPPVFLIHPTEDNYTSEWQIDTISLDENYIWTRQSKENWDLNGIFTTDFHFIIGERSVDEDYSRIVVYGYDANPPLTIELLEYDNEDYRVREVFEFEKNKIYILIEASNQMFYDIIFLTLNPSDLEGLFFAHPLLPHLITFGLVMLVTIPVFYKKSKNIGEPKMYPTTSLEP
jgi:hypothetical protein